MRRFALIAGVMLATAAGTQELWHTGIPAESYGIYFMVPVNLQNAQGSRGIDQARDGRRVVYNAPNMNVATTQETMVGFIQAKVRDTILGEYACKLYTSDYQVQGRRDTPIRSVQRRYETWVDFKGIVRRVKTYYKDDMKVMQIDAKFEKDSIELDMVENGKSKKLTMNPIQGLEAFHSPIPEMIKQADRDRQEKLWCVIDAKTGGIIEYKVRLKGRFVPPVGSTSKIKGFTFELKGPVGIHTMHVSDDGQLRQIDFADTSQIKAIYSRPLGGG